MQETSPLDLTSLSLSAVCGGVVGGIIGRCLGGIIAAIVGPSAAGQHAEHKDSSQKQW